MSLRPVLAAVLAAALLPAAATAAPIPAGPATTLAPLPAPTPFTAQPLPRTAAPQNPFLARDPGSNIHDDQWMSDAYDRAGPLGRAPQVASGSMKPGLCASLTFDRRGRIVSVCPSPNGPEARIIDPETLAVRATYGLPNAADLPGTPGYQNFTGGGYFFLDQKDRIRTVTKRQHLVTLAQSDDGRKLRKVDDIDLSPYVGKQDGVSSALPDSRGNVWFVVKRAGTVGVIAHGTRTVRTVHLGEEIENSFALDGRAVYIVSDKKMYRFGLRRDGAPRVLWSETYANSGIVKPSQVDAGSGTTPTVMAGGYVAITDNADPMNVVVYRTGVTLPAGQKRVVCEVPVFGKGASATENSLMGTGRMLIAENNYGYQGAQGARPPAPTVAGFARVDVKADGSGCTKVWETGEVAAPTVVPKLSTTTGLIYTYTRERDPSPTGADPWAFTAIDARTGRTAWSVRTGTGDGFNNNYAGLALGPDGSAYLGVLTGILRLRDAPVG